MYILFEDVSEQNKTKAIEELTKDSIAKPSFYFLVVLSVLMASYGLILNNASVVIGSMLIAPILSPLLSLSLGITLSDSKLRFQSFKTLVMAVAWSILISMTATFLLWRITGTVDFQESYNPEILARITPSLPYLVIAIIAGLATSFARVKPELNEALPGTAIAVALVPPLATIGIGLATLNFMVALGALALFVLNALGIVAASVVMFSLMRIYTKKKVAENSLAQAQQERVNLSEQFSKKKLVSSETDDTER